MCDNFGVVSRIMDCTAVNAIKSDKDLTDDTKEILRQIDDSVILRAAVVGPKEILKQNKKAPTHEDVKTELVDLGWKKNGTGWNNWRPYDRFIKKMNHDISPLFSTTVLNRDDFFTSYTLKEKLIGCIGNSSRFFPLDDSDIDPPEGKEMNAFVEDLKFVQGETLPYTYTTDFNMKTDESFSRIFFNGMGCVLLTKQEEVSDSEFGPFVVELPLHNLKVRELYRELGVRIHFNADQMVSAIYDYKMEKLYKPGDEGWSDAKLLANVTTFFLVTVREHLFWTHLIVSNDATRELTLKLPPSHPIRRLLTVFTFHTTEINLRAFDTLVPEYSFLHRSNPLEYESMIEVFDMAVKECNIYEPFSQQTYNSEIQRLVEEGKMPYVTEGSEYYEIVRTFVRNWVEKSGDTVSDLHSMAFYSAMKEKTKEHKYELPKFSVDNLIDLCSSIIFTVTSYHELVGHVVDYVIPERSGFRLSKKDPSVIDLQSFIYASLIGANTSVRMPDLMSEFPNFFGKGGAPSWERDVWDEFQQALTDQSEKVKKADAEREVEFKYFDPERFECSVSV